MKKLSLILPLALLCGFAAGCQNKGTLAELEELKARAEVEEKNKAFVRRYVETFNSGDYEALKVFLSSEYALYSPSGYQKPASREAVIENYKGASQAFSEFKWNVVDIIAEGDKVVSRMTADGTYKGGVPGLTKAEKRFRFSIITIMRIEAGKIREEWQEDDQLGLARQLGMELKPIESER